MAKRKPLKLNKWFKRSLLIFFAVGSTFWIADKVFPLNLTRYQDRSTLIYGENKALLHVFLTKDDKFRLYTTYDEVPELYIKTLLIKEDQYYFKHFGVNPFSILRSFYHNIRAKRIVSGGSTLTMQTARLLVPRKRVLSSKFIECFRALQLEWHFSKNEILNIYMTLAPFGSNIEGVKAASLAYFNKIPQSLSIPEIALLVAMVQSPNHLRPDRHPQKAEKARNLVLALMQANDVHYNAPLPKKIIPFPREIPHLAWRLKTKYPDKLEIESTINLSFQKQIEYLLKRYQPFLPQGANAAILILDHARNKPIVYVGSTNFSDPTDHGFVDYIKAYRSPGSTLKPFIYGLAFDLGLLQPESFILDARRRFGSYYPRNFDKDIHGMIQAKEALTLSLNIPAVSILNEIGVVRFLSLLKENGIYPKFPPFERPGLSSALGGLGMSLEQLVLLYSGLGNQGKIKSFSYLSSSEQSGETYFLSLRAANLITNILSLENGLSIKTGTSYGHRDALAIGYDKQYVIGVWIGTHNGAPMRSATGATLAIPLLQKIYAILPKNPQKDILTFEKSNDFIFKKLPQPLPSYEALRLLFPVDNTTIYLESKEIPCTAQGGTKPYTWLVDSKPLAVELWQQKYLWHPKKAGYYTITVIDASGKSVKAHIEVI